MEEKDINKTIFDPETKKKIQEDHDRFIRDFEFTCADPRGSIAFGYTERLRSLLRRKTVELKKYETKKADPEELKTISLKYMLAADELLKMFSGVIEFLRTENVRIYEEQDNQMPSTFGVYEVSDADKVRDIWDRIKYFYKNYCGNSDPIRIVKCRGCYLPELPNPYYDSSEIVGPKSMRKISEFMGLDLPVLDADVTEYADFGVHFDWDNEFARLIDVRWLFDVHDNSDQANLKLKACFDYGEHPWFDPSQWFKDLTVKQSTAADKADAEEILK